mmetsp:Transcript_1276/g.2921  ORF Transcript_1276/g.2921 Transcript_1276/m.2921 type:complete len:225 (+) Transcript_1276:664-1338(+)
MPRLRHARRPPLQRDGLPLLPRQRLSLRALRLRQLRRQGDVLGGPRIRQRGRRQQLDRLRGAGRGLRRGVPRWAPHPRRRRQRRRPPRRTPHHRPPLLLPPHLQLPDFHHRVLPKQLASGVVGLDRKAQSFWGQMRASQIIHRAQFSLCFVRQPVASFSGTHAGAVSFGGADPRLHASPMVFAKAMGHGSTASFKVRARKMYLGENGGGERGGEHDVRCDLDSE